MSLIIGIDLAINSTGVCILSENGNRKPRYYIITSKLSKLQKKFDHERVTIIQYNKKDKNLSHNIKEIGTIIKNELEKIDEPISFAVIEDVAIGGSGRVVDLSMLNGYVRAMLDILNIPHIEVRPTTVKKFYTGNGCADKGLMMSSWRYLDNDLDPKGIKYDDIADAHALASYGKESKAA